MFFELLFPHTAQLPIRTVP